MTDYSQEADDSGRAQVELEEFLYPEPDWDQPPEPVQDADKADGRLWHLRQLNDEAVRARTLAAKRNEQVDLWLAGELQRIDARRDHIRSELASWQRAIREDGTNSLTLPNGKLSSRVQQPDWEVEDEKAFLDWADAEAPELIRMTDPKPPEQRPDLKAIKAALLIPGDAEDRKYAPITADGEPVPGLSVTVRGPKFEAVPS